MDFDYWYDDAYGYDDYLSTDGYSGLFGGLLDGVGSLFGGLFGDDSYYGDYDYDYGWDDDEYFSVGSSDGLDDYSLLDSVFGLFDGVLSTDGYGSSGLVGFLDGVESVLGGLFSDDVFYDGYDYGYEDEYGIDEVISVGSYDSLNDLSGISGLDLESILGLLGGSGLNLSTDASAGLDLSSILGLLGGSGLNLSTDASAGLDLESVLGLLGGSGLNLSTDGTATASAGIDLSSILGLLGGSETSVSVDGSTTSALNGIDLSSIISQLGGSGTSISGSTTSALNGIDLSAILGLLGGSGSTISADGLSGLGNSLSGLMSIYSGVSSLGSGDSASWDDLSFLDNLTNVLPNVDGGTVSDPGSLLSSILGMLGGSGTSLTVDGNTATASSGLNLSSILGLLGGSGLNLSTDGTATASAGFDLSSILGLLGGSGLNLSTDGTATASAGIDLSSILGLLGGSGLNLSTDGTATASAGLDLSSILGLLGGSGLNLSTDASAGFDLSSILGLLGGSGLNLSTDASAGIDLSSILGLLGGSDTLLTVDGETSGLFSLQELLDKLSDGSAKLKVDITLTTDEGASSFQYEGLLSHFVSTVTADVGSLVTTTTFAPEMTVRGVALPMNDLVAEAEQLIGSVLQTVPVLSWGDENEAAAQGYWVEIARGGLFDDAIRVFTSGTSFDVDGSAGSFSCRAALRDGEFTTDAAEWTAGVSAPRQIVSNGNGLADVFFASPAEGDVWSMSFRAGNDLTGEIVSIAGKNRIRDTFSGSASDANILYLTDTANGDALFMDDVYSEFGAAARLRLIREIRSGAGGDVIDMTSSHYKAELAGMTVRGGSGNDVLWGAAGGNMLFGDDGDDRISGGSGADIIAGGSGDDVLNGGGGADLFTFGENWGNDVVSQINGGSVALWFAEDESRITAAELDGDVIFRNAAGTSSVTVKGMALADLELHFGGDSSACFTGLTAAGAFLGSTAESVFETQAARMQGVLASL